MNLSRLGGLVLLLLQLSCVDLSRMVAQQDSQELVPPQEMRLCLGTECATLKRAGDHYDEYDNEQEIVGRFWIKEWSADHVEFTGKALPLADGDPGAIFRGRISAAKNSIDGGIYNSRNDNQSTTAPFTLTWQGPGHATDLPDKMHLCAWACETLTWSKDHYDGVRDGQTRVATTYKIIHFEPGRNFASMVTLEAEINGTSVDFIGSIPIGATSIDAGIVPGIDKNGEISKQTFKATWDRSALTGKAAAYALHQMDQQEEREAARLPRRVNGILVPPGASDSFASYPSMVRAILLPEYAVTMIDAKRPCHDDSVHDANTALEIARFAYRAADIPRGNCWLYAAQQLGSTRAKVISATTFLYGWALTPKDEPKGFAMLKALLSTKDPWDIWILNQCYIDGTGTPKDAHQAAILASYALMHDDVYQVSQLVGSDDIALVRRFNRLQVLMDPPTKSQTSCRTVAPVEAHQAGVVNGQKCTTTTVVDNDRLQRKLADIDSQH